MDCVLFTRLGARSARGRGGGATSWATCGMTCGTAESSCRLPETRALRRGGAPLRAPRAPHAGSLPR
eukprot:10036377-Alexandrium_andersonii.AAC.1